MRHSWLRLVLDCGLAIAAIVAFFAAQPYTLHQLTQAMCYGIGVLGLKLLSGYNGQFSLGHSIFFVVGAYVTASLTAGGWNLYLTLPLACAAAFVVGFAVGWPALRIRGHHLAVVMLIFALAAPQIVRSSLLAPVTGGPMGIWFSAPAVPVDGLDDDRWWYLLTLAFSVLSVAVASVIVRSRLGRAMQANRDNVTAAAAAGVNTASVNTLSFGISAAFAGLAGGLLMGPLAYVSPDSFSAFLGIALFVAVVVTTPLWIGGAFLGGLLIVYLPNWAQSIAVGLDKSQSLILAVYGILLLAILYAQRIDWRRLLRLRRSATEATGAKDD